MFSRNIVTPFAILSLMVATAISAVSPVERASVFQGSPPCKQFTGRYKDLPLKEMQHGSGFSQNMYSGQHGEAAMILKNEKQIYLKATKASNDDWNLFVITVDNTNQRVGIKDHVFDLDAGQDCVVTFNSIAASPSSPIKIQSYVEAQL